jgi:hypothetical protein
MVEVVETKSKVDVNGKKYKHLTLFSPEHKIKVLTKFGVKEMITPSKKCGYIAYEFNYSKEQKSDPWFNLNKGDKVPGRIVTKKIVPCIAGSGDILTTCTVPVFCSEEDPIDFEIALEKAFIRAGKRLAKGELKYGEIAQEIAIRTPTKFKIPESCLVVNTIK